MVYYFYALLSTFPRHLPMTLPVALLSFNINDIGDEVKNELVTTKDSPTNHTCSFSLIERLNDCQQRNKKRYYGTSL